MCQIKLSFRKISWKCLGLAVIISTSSDVCSWSFAYASYMCINSLDLVNLINRSSTPNPASFCSMVYGISKIGYSHTLE